MEQNYIIYLIPALLPIIIIIWKQKKRIRYHIFLAMGDSDMYGSLQYTEAEMARYGGRAAGKLRSCHHGFQKCKYFPSC